MTAQQNSIIHALFHTTGLMGQKKNIVGGISFGRTESTKELTLDEVNMLIRYLQDIQGNAEKANKMRRKIISMAHQLHWYLPGTQKVDMKRIDNWCIQYGYLHKKLNDHNEKELIKLVSQFANVFADFLDNTKTQHQ